MSTDNSARDGYARCPTCGLPYWAVGYPLDLSVKQATCQCNRYYYIPTQPDRGWICPKCGRVYSPNTKECLTCNNPLLTTSTDWESIP